MTVYTNYSMLKQITLFKNFNIKPESKDFCFLKALTHDIYFANNILYENNNPLVSRKKVRYGILLANKLGNCFLRK